MTIQLFMKKNHTIKILTLIFVITMLTGFGCKGLSKDDKQAIKTVSLEYWTVADDVDELKKLINVYGAARPYLKISVRQLRESELYSRLVEALSEDKGPDIVSVHNRSLAAYRSKLAIMPSSVSDSTVTVINGKLRKETIVNSLTVLMPTLSQIDSEYVGVVKDDVIYQKEIYGLPLSLDVMAVYYNKDLLDRAGVAEPPKDWTEFQAAVKKITKYDKDGKIVQSGTALGLGSNVIGFDDILYMLFAQTGLSFTDSSGYVVFNGGTGSLTNSVVKVMDFYTDYANKNKDVYSWDSNMGNSLEEFVRGKAGFYFGYSSDLKTIKSQAPQLNVRVMPMLQLNKNNPVNVASYWLQTVTKKSTNQNEAWALINYLTHSSETKKYLDATGRPTALRAFITAQNQDLKLKPFSSQVLIAKNWYKGKSYEIAKTALSEMLRDWLEVSPTHDRKSLLYSQILDRAASRVNQGL
jgi:multiple sugar transport system substrate-binding protein